MISTTSAPMELRPMHSEALSAHSRKHQSFESKEQYIQLRSISVNILASLFYGFFLYSAFRFWLKTGSLVHTGIIMFNTILIICFLTRRRPLITGSAANWVLAPLALILPMLVRPVASSSQFLVALSGGGQVVGLAIMITSLIALNRSMGIVAANRGIKTRGPYALVRHPLYTGEILFFTTFLVANWTLQNGLLVFLIVTAQVVRALQEEALLLQDGEYQRYRLIVHYRFIPGVV